MNTFILCTAFWGALCFILVFSMENAGCTKFVLLSYTHGISETNVYKCSLMIRDELWVSGKVGMVFKGQQKMCRFVPNAASLSPVVLYQPIKLLLLQKQFKVPQTCFKIFIKYCTNITPMVIAVLAQPGAVWMQHCRTNFRLHMHPLAQTTQSWGDSIWMQSFI